MKIHRAYRYELDPNVEERILLAKHAGAARFAYNWGLARWIEIYEKEGRTKNAMELHRELNCLKKTDFPWMYEVSKWAPQEALRDLEKAFQNFFRGRIGAVRLKEKPVRRKKGVVKTHFPKGCILHATVSREADRWFVSLTVEEEILGPFPLKGPAAGIDAGLESFTTLADETGAIRKTDAPRPLRRALKRLRRLQRKLSRRGVRDEKGRLIERTKNYEKTRLEIARLHRRIRNIRLDFLHKLTTELVRTHPVIATLDLDVRNLLKNRRLARTIADVGWGTFRALLEAKPKLRGVRIVKANRFEPTSKMCHACGYVLPELPLSVRAWTCPVCGAHHDRDENAAKNLLRFALVAG